MMVGVSTCETKSRLLDGGGEEGRAEKKQQHGLLMRNREATGGDKRGALRRDPPYH